MQEKELKYWHIMVFCTIYLTADLIHNVYDAQFDLFLFYAQIFIVYILATSVYYLFNHSSFAPVSTEKAAGMIILIGILLMSISFGSRVVHSDLLV
ncbi:hypothetical protein [Marinilactibacillus piezotolerans]|uniref:hypothetical protein n=1 Tax=Marinilactibacillus piezotolerans TaxID=258723 RepID=UPI0009B18FC0|nr:hypothetical protein [Marinilactibacillus piezotolerans]